MTPSVHIRPARAGEHDALTDLALRAKAYWGYTPAFLEACRADIQLAPDYLARARVGVAETESRIAGFFGLSLPEREPELVHLWIEPDFIGQGIGRELWEKAVGEARALGWAAFRIVSEPHARGFYEKQGAVFVANQISPVDRRREIPVLTFAL